MGTCLVTDVALGVVYVPVGAAQRAPQYPVVLSEAHHRAEGRRQGQSGRDLGHGARDLVPRVIHSLIRVQFSDVDELQSCVGGGGVVML